jgi:hypothetical protein
MGERERRVGDMLGRLVETSREPPSKRPRCIRPEPTQLELLGWLETSRRCGG